MLKMRKSYACKYFYKQKYKGKQTFYVDRTYCDKFLYDGKTIKCYVDNANKFYNMVSVYDKCKWVHPIKFINAKIGDEKECQKELLIQAK